MSLQRPAAFFPASLTLRQRAESRRSRVRLSVKEEKVDRYFPVYATLAQVLDAPPTCTLRKTYAGRFASVQPARSSR